MNAKLIYWTSVIKNFSIFLLTLVLILIIFKLAFFYIPFFIGFIVSLIIEPAIKKLANKTGLTRKTSAIIILILLFTLLIGGIIWGIITLVSESSNLLESFNIYIEKIYNIVQKYILNIRIKEVNLPQNVISIIETSTTQLLGTITKYVTTFLSNFMQKITFIPIAFIYFIITILSTYFICADKFYILDQLEHHVPRMWVKKFAKHVREISLILGNYLKAESILILISFFIILAGLLTGKIIGLKIEYPLLSALLISFVDAMPILRFRNSNYSMGYCFCIRREPITCICINWIIYYYNSNKANARTKVN